MKNAGALSGTLPPRARLWIGLLLIPSFLFQGELLLRAAQVVLFMILAVQVGRRIRVMQVLLLSAGIVAMNLLTPFGRVLASFGPVTITLGALQTGLLKASTMIGLIYLSLFTISSDIPLPGRFGGLIARMIYYFEKILETEKRIDRRNLIASLDALLFRMREGSDEGNGTPLAGARSAGTLTLPGLLVAGGLLLANWGALVLTRVIP